jgi:hypothetical protein
VTFEPGSKLKSIAKDAFAGCTALKSISLPASLEVIAGSAFSGCSRCKFEVDPANPNYQVKDGFLVCLRTNCLVRAGETGSEIQIPDYIEILGEFCFDRCELLCSVRFGERPRVREIEYAAFMLCEMLAVFSVPSSVVRLGTICFSGCSSLHWISFCPGSQLREVGGGAFSQCRGLQSISLPSSVEKIESECFEGCVNLEEVNIPEDSKLVSIERGAFKFCRALRSLVVPASLEFLGLQCFQKCSALTSVRFGSPSHLRTLLSLPQWVGVIEIPDSVQTLNFIRESRSLKPCAFVFGPGSRLSEFKLEFRASSLRGRCLIHFSSWTVKRFRSQLEFAL